jgi:uncharacterized protein YjbI with pentapeptide repeats
VRLALGPLADARMVGPEDIREGERYDGVDFTDADLEFTSFTSCAFQRVRLNEARLRGARFSEVTLEEVDAAVLTAPRSSWRNVQLTGSRLGSMQLYESNWRSVTIEGSKIDYLNARSAQWQDVRWQDCTISELDLGQAVISRMAFQDCRIGTLHAAQAQLGDVDLRGADLRVLEGLAGLAGSWITESQLEDLAPQLAAHLSISVG